MFGSALEVVIGLFFVYLTLSLVCSAITEFGSWVAQRRSHYLEDWLKRTFTNEQQTLEFLDQPLIKSLVSQRGRTNGNTKPGKGLSHIPPRTFAKAVFGFVNPEMTLPTAANQIAALRNAAAELGGEEIARVVEFAVREAKEDLTKALDVVEKWFDDSMTRVSTWYQQWAKKIGIVVAAFLVIVLNADTINITARLWNDPTVREAFVASADQQIAEPELPDAPDTPQDVVNAVEQLPALGLPIGWFSDEFVERTDETGQVVQVRKGGWSGLGDALADGLAGWRWLPKLGGFILTTAALTLGAPFWFDMLKRVAGARKSATAK